MAASDLVISVGATIKDLERQLAAGAKLAERAADEIEAKFRKTNPSLGGDFGLGLLKGAIAGIAFDKITRGLIDANAEIAKFGETARRVGLDIVKFQELRLGAAAEGIDGKKFDSGIDGLAKKLNDARTEENELSKLFDANNVKLKDRTGEIISTNEALSVAADLISRAATEQDKVKIAEAFGLPADFVPLLEGGAAALEKLARNAGEAGAILEAEVIAKAKAFDDAWNAAWSSFASNAKASIISAAQGIADLISQAGTALKAIDAANRAGSQVNERAALRDQARQMALGNAGGRSALDAEQSAASRARVANFRQSEIDLRNRQVEAPLPPGRPRNLRVAGTATNLPAKATGGGGGGGSGGKSDEDKAQDRLDRYIESLTRQRNVMEAEIATFGKSNAVKQAAVEIAKAQVDLDKLSATEKQNYIDKLTTEVAKNEEVRASKERLKLAEKGLKDAQQFFGNAAVDALEDLIINGAKAEDVVASLTKQLAKAALQAALMGSGPLAGVFGTAGANGATGGLFGALFSGVLFGKAAGGPVNAGQPYRIGERGPETFVPTTPGRIIPASRSGSMTFSPSVTIDARGSTLSESQMRAIVAQSNAQLKAELPGYLVKQNQRGGQ